MTRFFLIVLLVLSVTVSGQPDSGASGNRIRIYDYPMDPRLHPDDMRRLVRPPDSKTFGNQIQFMALRSLDGDYRKLLDQYTVKYRLGNIIWPSYPVLFRSDLPDVVAELKKRNLYLFDLWGFVPGSGPGGYWQQYVVPDHVTELFEKELGDHWLGIDNGEQDGRYVGGYSNQMFPAGGGREQQYLNFQNHFQGLTDRLGNKMATLVSLNFGHYFLKEGVYTMIGAETAQGLPNTQIYYSFIRGAGKQYGVPWFGNASVWNRWGWKNYSGISDYNGGDTKGTSLSLLKRLIYSHIMYDCAAVGFESSFLDKNDDLSPVGRIQQSAVKWVGKYGDPGNLYTPVAILLDFYSGWSFPRHLYTNDIFRVWGNLPYDEGDYFTDNLLNMIYPGYRDASYFHNEEGFITPTPFGDATDCLLSDAPSWVLRQYPVLIVGDKLTEGEEIRDKLENYVETGGKLIITAGSLASLPGGLCGITAGKTGHNMAAGSMVSVNGKLIGEPSGFMAEELLFQPGARTIASCNNIPLAVENQAGNGSLIVIASPFGLAKGSGDLKNPGEDAKMNSPWPMLQHVKEILGTVLKGTMIFDPVDGLSLITCRKSKGEYTVALCNSTWNEKSFRIKTSAGKILKISELPLDYAERKAVGYLPGSVTVDPGHNTSATIAGGDIRIFRVSMEENGIEEIPFIKPPENPVNRGLSLRHITSLKEEILLRPTFFQHFDRVLIDWKYLAEMEREVLVQQSLWIRNQGVKVAVDLSSGINLFPDLRLVCNDTAEYQKSIQIIHSLLDKMQLIGASDLIIALHRTIENNFTDEQFSSSIRETLGEICRNASEKGINVHLRPLPGRYASDLSGAFTLVTSLRIANLYVAPSLSELEADGTENSAVMKMLSDPRCSIIFVAASGRDISGKIYSLNQPIADTPADPAVKNILRSSGEKILILDALYGNKNDEYRDIKKLEEIISNKL